MTILLDTNACIAVMNRRPPLVRAQLDRAIEQGETIAVSAVSVFELWYGVAKSARVAFNTDRVGTFLAPVLILPLDENDAQIAGTIRANLERAGTPMGPYDYLIAAQSLRHDLTLITANEKEFARVAGLKCENWTS